VITTRFLSSSKPALPYICLLMFLSLLTCPAAAAASTGLLLQLEIKP
jgi:hypothetical protein